MFFLRMLLLDPVTFNKNIYSNVAVAVRANIFQLKILEFDTYDRIHFNGDAP